MKTTVEMVPTQVYKGTAWVSELRPKADTFECLGCGERNLKEECAQDEEEVAAGFGPECTACCNLGW